MLSMAKSMHHGQCCLVLGNFRSVTTESQLTTCSGYQAHDQVALVELLMVIDCW